MIFHAFIEDILGSKTKIRVLRALYLHPEKEFTQREFSKKFGIPQQSISWVAEDLSKHNLILVRTVGKSTLFKANKDSYTFGIVKKLFENEKNAQEALKETVSKKLAGTKYIKECVIFGSIARGDEKTGSDVDLFVVCDAGHENETLEKTSELNGILIRRFGNPLTPLIVSTKSIEDWKKKNRFLFEENIMKDGIRVKLST